MALVLKIVDANGIARTVQARPGDRIAVRRGDSVTVVEGADVRVERNGNDLVIIHAEGRIVLGGFYPEEPPSALAATIPGADTPPPADANQPSAPVTSLTFDGSDGLNVVTPLGTQVNAGGALADGTGLPEGFTLPENSALRSPLSSGSSGGGQGGQAGSPPPPPGEEPPPPPHERH